MTKGSKWLVGIVLGAIVVTAAGLLAWNRLRPISRPQASGGGPTAPQERSVPVTVVPAARRDVPVYLSGLGNVVASMTVTVKTQLDGRLEQVLFKEGQTVRRGQLLAQIDPRPYQVQLEQAQGSLARDQAQLKNAQLNVARDRELVRQNLIAQQQLDTDLSTAGQLEGAIQVDKAAIDAAELNLDYARITAPIDGVTGVRQVDPGNVVHTTDASGIVLITKLDPIAILFSLPQDQLTPVLEELGRSGTLPADAFSRDGSTLLGSGRVTLIDNQINQATSTIRLKAEVPNPRRLLWPNQFVNVRLHLNTQKDALVVPATALQRGPNGTFVYVAGADASALLRPVEVSLIQGDLAILSRGVEPDEQVVVDGQNQLRPGVKVVAREAGRPAAAGKEAAANARSGQGSSRTVAEP